MLPTSENIHTEFKRTFNEDVVETLVAFANDVNKNKSIFPHIKERVPVGRVRLGGSVYVGVTDKGNVCGVSVGNETHTELDK